MSIAYKYQQLKQTYHELLQQATVDPRWGCGTAIALQRHIDGSDTWDGTERRRTTTERVDVLVGDICGHGAVEQTAYQCWPERADDAGAQRRSRAAGR